MKTDKFTLFVYCNFLVLLSTTVYSQNINKQNVNIADETLTDYCFLSWYHYTKSIKELFKKTISNSSLNFHVYWDTLYIYMHRGIYIRGEITRKKCKMAILLYCFHTAGVLYIFMLYNLLGHGISFYRKSKINIKRKPNYEIGWFHN